VPTPAPEGVGDGHFIGKEENMAKFFAYNSDTGKCLCKNCTHTWTAGKLLKHCMSHAGPQVVDCPNCGQHALMESDADDWDIMIEDEMNSLIDSGEYFTKPT
jgi:hypothetical protein